MNAVAWSKLTETVVRKYMAAPNVATLRDKGSRLRLRFNTGRTGGSWYVVDFTLGKTRWHKLGNYPDVSVKAILAALPDVERSLVVDREASVTVSGWTKSGDVLNWYWQRMDSDANITAERKATVASALRCHLVPRLGDLKLADVRQDSIDECLIWPMQAKYSLSHVRSVFSVLKTAFKQAQQLKKINPNPMAGLIFSDFITAEIKPKDGRLRAMNLPMVFNQLTQTARPVIVLTLMMLCFGTRIGETRKARWRDFDFKQGQWFIPACHTKTREAHRLPLSNLAISFLKDYKRWQSQSRKTQYLFPTEGMDQCVSSRTANNWIRLVSDGQWTAHDCRKLARTQWTDLGVDYMVGELLLNHALSKLDKTYIHTYAETQARAAIELYHQWLITQNINVVTETIPRQSIQARTPKANVGAGFSAVVSLITEEEVNSINLPTN